MTEPKQSLGFSGKIAAYFENSQLTPLLALVGLLLGILAIFITPREEEPQINVTMANIFVPFPGASVSDVENLVTSPMEQILGEINEVDHIYSVSRPGMSVLTVQYKVGVPRTEALVRLYNAIYSNQDWRPSNIGILPPLVKPKGIDDVPVVALTLFTKDPARGAFDLKQIAHALEAELKRVPGTRNINTIGGPEQIARVALDPQKLAARGLSVTELRQALLASNAAFHASAIIDDNAYIPVQAGEFLSNRDELAELIVGLHAGKPVYLQDVARIEYGPSENQNYVWYALAENHHTYEQQPAVTLSISKKSGENAVEIANKIIERVPQLKGSFIPDGVEVAVTRNYGATADEKASKLIQKLIFATISVVALVLLTLGWREAIVVGSAVILTLAITLFASWAWGFTINRVSLFALIFSIGILVDDAIVIVENIHRHIANGSKNIIDAIPLAVNEVGGPTILATFTVIAALMPMAFVTGLMGPYMSPIPINASMGMLISLVIALTFTPWLSSRMISNHVKESTSSEHVNEWLSQSFHKTMTPFLGQTNRRNRYWLAGSIIALIFLAISLVLFKVVVLKMLPFDNKSEFQVVVDLPEGATVEQTNAALGTLADYLITLPEVTDIQSYAGTASPIGFNGLVRQYYLRQSPNLGDIQVNLKDKHNRTRSSHEIALAARSKLEEIAKNYQANIKVVEVPPGPPVLAPLLAEVYGPDYPGQIQKAKQLRKQFEQSEGIVDIDDSVESNAPRLIVSVNRQKAALLGVNQEEVTNAIAAALGGVDVTFLHTGHAKYPIPVRMELPVADKADIESLLALKVKSASGKLIPISEVVNVHQSQWENSIHHKDLLPVVYVTGDMAGKIDSPLYGMIAIMGNLKKEISQFFIRQPENTYNYSIKWDGEWQITYETFRDMGLAYSVGLILIYLLVVGQFRSYAVPLIIMAPIPLTLIGILPGHALLGAQFTATSMIGMIALAGIIVRNSILLVDFINKSLLEGNSIESAVIQAAAVRAKPIILTGLAAMLGAFFILDDPIFNGLAVSLIFGILVSTLLTLVVIPILYYCLIERQQK
ncbi:MAG: efflux RND transporter permease subunit [Gammaproteobacteria bacterium]|jgi:multidrug efflux pump subunit AcrB|nr:efflux RND transporter permease subunit [Gammaproteobacteria bacterium]